MTDREVMQQALHELEGIPVYRKYGVRISNAITALRTALEQQQAEPMAWDKPSASFDKWWYSYHHDPANPFAEGSAAYWAWAGWQAAQRQWVGLTDEQLDDIAVVARKGNLHDLRIAIEAAHNIKEGT